MEDLTFYKKMIEMMPAVVFINQIDDLNDFSTSKNIYMNPCGLNNINYTREEIDQMGPAFFPSLMHPDDLIQAPDSISYLNMKQGETYGGLQRILYADGKYHWSFGYAAIFEMKDEKPWRFISCQVDVDNQMHTHKQFLELLKENSLLKNELILKSLTKREIEITRLIAKGKTDKEIANELFISIKTAKTHRNNIIRKLKMRNSADLVRFAVENIL